jgi:hypothetical protein
MGMPICTYTVLRALTERPEIYDYELHSAKAALEPFNLFAFIIHDPEQHKGFAHALTRHFDHLDYITGEGLLFFALVDPSPAWLEHGAPRRYYQHLRNWESNELLQNSGIRSDKRETALALCLSLGIPYDDLPVIVVTSDFQAKDVRWTRTSEALLHHQLETLGYIAQRFPDIKHDRPLFGSMWREYEQDLAGPEGISSHRLESSLAKALSNVLAAVTVGETAEPGKWQDQWVREQALLQAQQSLSELHDGLNYLRVRNGIEADAQIFDDLALRIATVQSLLMSEKEIVLPVPIDLLEAESAVMMLTGTRVLNYLAAQDADSDFTACAICFAKVFEKESSLSAVHWIRQHLGIDLPPYFGRQQPGVSARMQTGTGPVDFNRADENGKWRPPEMGRSCWCYHRLLHENHVPTGFAIEEARLLAERWDTIRQMRNTCAHQALLRREEADRLMGELRSLSETGLLKLMSDLKLKLSGRVRG